MDDTDLLDFVDGLYGYAMTITRNPTDAEDLVQETCLRAIPRMRSLRPEKQPEELAFHYSEKHPSQSASKTAVRTQGPGNRCG